MPLNGTSFCARFQTSDDLRNAILACFAPRYPELYEQDYRLFNKNIGGAFLQFVHCSKGGSPTFDEAFCNEVARLVNFALLPERGIDCAYRAAEEILAAGGLTQITNPYTRQQLQKMFYQHAAYRDRNHGKFTTFIKTHWG